MISKVLGFFLFKLNGKHDFYAEKLEYFTMDITKTEIFEIKVGFFL